MPAQPRSVGRQISRFAAAGVINTAIDYAGFILLTSLLRLPLDRSWIAKSISGALAMITSFVLNRRWVFAQPKAQAPALATGQGAPARPSVAPAPPGEVAPAPPAATARQQLVRFLVVTLIGTFVVQLGGTHLLSAIWPAPGELAFRVVRAVHLDGLLSAPLVVRTVAFGVATLASMTWNYLSYRSWVFATSAVPTPPTEVTSLAAAPRGTRSAAR